MFHLKTFPSEGIKKSRNNDEGECKNERMNKVKCKEGDRDRAFHPLLSVILLNFSVNEKLKEL